MNPLLHVGVLIMRLFKLSDLELELGAKGLDSAVLISSLVKFHGELFWSEVNETSLGLAILHILILESA